MLRPVTRQTHLRRARFWLAVFMVGLVLSGITAFPLGHEIRWLDASLHTSSLRAIATSTGLVAWVDRVSSGVIQTNARFPFLAYGTDWLAFAHLVIAVAFIGPYIDPVRNKWVITFGLIACAGVIPMALIAGPIRGIPLGWRLIDCSFGVIGSLLLFLCRRHVPALERDSATQVQTHRQFRGDPKVSGQLSRDPLQAREE